MTNGQGALEYLLLLGGALAVASVIIVIILTIAPLQSSSSKNAAYLAEVKKLQVLTGVDLSTLKAMYRFEKNIDDTSGKGNTGTIFDSSSTQLSYATGKSGFAVSSGNGNTAVIDTPGAAIGTLNDFTVLAWTSYATASNSPYIIFGYTGPRASPTVKMSLQVLLSGSNMSLTTAVNGNNYSIPTLATSLSGPWHHVAWVRSGSTQNVYIDCQLVASPSVDSTAVTATGGLMQVTSAYSIDEIMILGKALNGNEIRALGAC